MFRCASLDSDGDWFENVLYILSSCACCVKFCQNNMFRVCFVKYQICSVKYQICSVKSQNLIVLTKIFNLLWLINCEKCKHLHCAKKNVDNNWLIQLKVYIVTSFHKSSSNWTMKYFRPLFIIKKLSALKHEALLIERTSLKFTQIVTKCSKNNANIKVTPICLQINIDLTT